MRLKAECISRPRRAARRSRSASTAPMPRNRSAGSHLLLAVGRVPNTDDLGLDKAGVETDARGLHRRRRRAEDQRAGHLGDRRLQRPRRLHPHLLQRLRDRRRQPARRRQAQGERPHLRPTRCSSIRRSGGAGMTEREARATGKQAAGGQAADDAHRAGARAQRDAGFHEDGGRRRAASASSAPRSSASRATRSCSRSST